MKRHSLAISSRGTRVQSGLPKGSATDSPMRVRGITFQGVVHAVYVYDSPASFGTNIPDGVPINGIYVDVLCYGKHQGIIPRVLATYTRQGIHEGEISLPRATNSVVSNDLNPLQSNPYEMDGDHVIVGFLEDDIKRPYILKYLPHPVSDVGNGDKTLGHRMRIKEGEGSPRLWKHKGSYWGIDSNGNYITNLTRAHPGSYFDGCVEPEPTLAGNSGNYTIRLPQTSKLTLEITKDVQNGDGTDSDSLSTKLLLENNKLTILNEGGAGVLIQDKDDNAFLTLGDGAVHAAVSEHLEELWNRLVQYLATATVLTALGPSSVLPTLAGPPPAWDPTVESSSVSFPDG